MFNKKLRKEKMVNGVSISVVGNPALEHDELAPSNNFANGLVMSSDQQTLFAHAMLMRRRKDALRRRVRGRNKMPEIHDGVYAKAGLDSSGNMWEQVLCGMGAIGYISTTKSCGKLNRRNVTHRPLHRFAASRLV